jgi:hypothetical protein
LALWPFRTWFHDREALTYINTAAAIATHDHASDWESLAAGFTSDIWAEYIVAMMAVANVTWRRVLDITR